MPDQNSVRMKCPRCAVSTIDPATGSCELCGFRIETSGSGQGVDAIMELATRELAHEFEILGIAGRRDGAIVFRAEERSGGRKVVLKVVERAKADADAELRFRGTMETHQRLDHPHIVQILRFGSTDSLLWCAATDTGGITLRTHLAAERRLDARTARRIATQLVSALEYIHRRGIAHGGVKPENILIDPQGWVWLADPGYSYATVDSRPTWWAPELDSQQSRTPASDQFALAATLFECVTGEPPMRPGDRAAQFRPEVPLGLSRALSRALDGDPARRFPSCADFLVALEQEEGGRLSPVATPRPPAETEAIIERPSARASTQALLIPDWEPPDAGEMPRRKPVGLIIGIVVLVGIAAAVPTLLRKIEAARQPAMAVGVPALISSLPSTPAPEATTTAPTPPQPDAAPRRETAPPPRTDTPPRSVAPSSIPRASTPAPTPPAAEAATPAKLFINASPWGQVFIDDVLVGNTPRANLEVAPGEHVIRVSRQGYSTFSRTVRLEPGETLRITDIVLTPTTP